MRIKPTPSTTIRCDNDFLTSKLLQIFEAISPQTIVDDILSLPPGQRAAGYIKLAETISKLNHTQTIIEKENFLRGLNQVDNDITVRIIDGSIQIDTGDTHNKFDDHYDFINEDISPEIEIEDVVELNDILPEIEIEIEEPEKESEPEHEQIDRYIPRRHIPRRTGASY